MIQTKNKTKRVTMGLTDIKSLRIPLDKEEITARDIMEAQAMFHASTDDIYNELMNRLLPSENVPKTGLEAFRTEILFSEITERLQKLTLAVTFAQNSLMLGHAALSMGDVFHLTHRTDLDGYKLQSESNITGSTDT